MQRPEFPRVDLNDEDVMFAYQSLAAPGWTSSGLGLWWSATCVRRGNLQNLLANFPNGDWPPTMLIRAEEVMLKGMAVECMLKAVYLFEKHTTRELTVAEVEAQRWLGRHDLAEMADGAGFEVSRDEREVLDILSLHVKWRGRYPAPREKHKAEWRRVQWELWNQDRVCSEMWERLVKRAHRWSATSDEARPKTDTAGAASTSNIEKGETTAENPVG